MSAQNSSTQTPTQDTHSESDIHARLFPILARVASVTAVLMYVFYFPQIIGNINGHKGDWIQPLVAGINCTLWVAYGLWREKKDWAHCDCEWRPALFLAVQQPSPRSC